eukprot:535900_1
MTACGCTNLPWSSLEKNSSPSMVTSNERLRPTTTLASTLSPNISSKDFWMRRARGAYPHEPQYSIEIRIGDISLERTDLDWTAGRPEFGKVYRIWTKLHWVIRD